MKGKIRVYIDKLLFVFEGESSNAYSIIVMDDTGFEFNPDDMEEPHNPTIQKIHDMLSATNKEIWSSCENYS